MLRTGDQIGPYVLVRKLGRGAFGFVWLAERRTVIATTQVALKIPIDDEIDIATITAEAALWVNASGHPNVLPIIEANLYEDLVVLVSEYAPDGSLADWLKQNGGSAPSVAVAIDMVSGILAGLEHLHSRRIIHRDLKPPNILLQGQKPRLLDFGVSRVLKNTGHSSVVAGTPQYMAPEAFSGIRNEQTDLWSAAVILYQMLSGRLPFPQTDIAALAVSIQNSPLAPLPSWVPEPLNHAVVRALQKDPRMRYASATVMRQSLEGIASPDTTDRYATVRIVNDVPSNPAASTVLGTTPNVSHSDPRARTDRPVTTYGTAPAVAFDQLQAIPARMDLAQQPVKDGPLLRSSQEQARAVLLYFALSILGWSISLGGWVFTAEFFHLRRTIISVLFAPIPVTILIAAQFLALRQYIEIRFPSWWLATCVSVLSLFGLLYQGHLGLQIACGVSGVLMGILQWVVLRKKVAQARWWILCTVAAALVLTFIVPWLNYSLGDFLSTLNLPRFIREPIHATAIGITLGACFGIAQAVSLLGFRRKTDPVESEQR